MSEDIAKKVLIALGHIEVPNGRCEAVEFMSKTAPERPESPPRFCSLRKGHDGDHCHIYGTHKTKLRSDLVEVAPLNPVCEKCRVTWPCSEAEKVYGVINYPAPSTELVERITARLTNLWAEQKNCEFKHENPDCSECKQAAEIAREFNDCLSAINQQPDSNDELVESIESQLTAHIKTGTLPIGHQWVKYADALDVIRKALEGYNHG